MSFENNQNEICEQLIMKNADKPFMVNSIRIEGLKNTSHEFLHSVTWPLMEAKTLRDIIVGSQNIALKLGKFGIFKSIDVSLDSPTNSKGAIDVICKIVFY